VIGQGSVDPTNLGSGAKPSRCKWREVSGEQRRRGAEHLRPDRVDEIACRGVGGGIIDVGTGLNLVLNDAGQFSGTGVLTKTGGGTLSLGHRVRALERPPDLRRSIIVSAGILTLRDPQAAGGGAGGTIAALTMAAGTTLNCATIRARPSATP